MRPATPTERLYAKRQCIPIMERCGSPGILVAELDDTNHLLYRTYKPGARDSQIDLLKEKLYYGKAVRSDITRITRRLGDEIGKVYGWDFPKPRQAVSVER